MTHLRTTPYILMLALLSLCGRVSAQSPTVYQVSTGGNLWTGTHGLVEHAIRQAELSGASAVVIDMDLEGDDFELAEKIAAEISQSPISVYAYVNNRAWNAAALVALASDSIYMAPGATLGGHGEVSLPDPSERDTSEVPLPALFARYATTHGVDASIGRAMVDSTVVVPELSDAMSRLELGAQQAVELGVAVAGLSSLDQLLNRVDLAESRVSTVGEEWLATTVVIDNRNWNNINVFLRLSGGARQRLGTVTSNSTARYTVPGHRVLGGSYVQVIVEIIGSSEGLATEVVQVAPGLVVEWTIENVLQHSTYFVWVRS